MSWYSIPSPRMTADNAAVGQTLRGVKLSQGALPAGQRVFVDVAKASISVRTFQSESQIRARADCEQQRQAFVDPQDVDPTRSLDKYLVTDGAGR